MNNRLIMIITAVTIAGWIAFGARSPIGYLDKVIEISLIGLLFLDMRKAA